MDSKQDAPPPHDPLAVNPPTDASGGVVPAPEDASVARRRAADGVGGAVHAGLLRWLTVLSLGLVVSVVFNRPDAALFIGIAGMFVLTQSWDTRDRARSGDPEGDFSLTPGGAGKALRVVLPLLVPLSGALLYAAMGIFARGLPHTTAHVAAMQWCIAAAAVCVLMAFPPVAQMVANALLHGAPAGYTARLTAGMVMVLLLLPVPVRLLIDDGMGYLHDSGRPLVDVGSLVGQLFGEVLFALAAVGLWVGRDMRAVRDRLGLGGMGVRHWIVAALGLGAVIGMNAGMEWIEREHFHALWLADQSMGLLIAGEISVTAALVLGVSAGVGEEMLVRGALQPRAGLVWASLLFAAGHVQYTWFGMLTIALLGVTLGLVRNRANTTTAIVVHALYDIIAALGIHR